MKAIRPFLRGQNEGGFLMKFSYQTLQVIQMHWLFCYGQLTHPTTPPTEGADISKINLPCLFRKKDAFANRV